MTCCKSALIILLSLFMLASGCVSVFASHGKDIRSIDFRNFTYYQIQGWGREKLTLRNGKYSEKDQTGVTSSKLMAVRYVDLDADGKEEAVIDVRTESYGSICCVDDYYILRYRRGVLYPIFHISKELSQRMVVRGRSITIVAPFWSDGSGPFCCPPYIETVVYRWRQSKMVIARRKLKKKFYPGMKWYG